MPRKKPATPHKYSGEVIGEAKCPDCGGALPIKINCNGTVYMRCYAIIAPGKPPERCGYVRTWGRVASRRLVKEWENERPDDQVSPEAGPEPGPEPGPAEPERGGAWFERFY